jgi:hypothetical protein
MAFKDFMCVVWQIGNQYFRGTNDLHPQHMLWYLSTYAPDHDFNTTVRTTGLMAMFHIHNQP